MITLDTTHFEGFYFLPQKGQSVQFPSGVVSSGLSLLGLSSIKEAT